MSQELLYLDAAACILLAAAAAFRARLAGGHLAGAVLLGLLCGLCPLLLRMCLPAPPDQNWDWLLAHSAPWALGGAVVGGLPLQMAMLRQYEDNLYFWLDSLALALNTCLHVVLFCLLGWSPLCALVLAVLLGLAPGLIRDVTLGYVAALVEENWYGMAAVLGAMLTLLCVVLDAAGLSPLELSSRGPEAVYILLGTAAMLGMRVWRRRAGL